MNQPNIILIMTDQQRFDTVGAWGYDHMSTPHIDALARGGVSFRQAYCPGATCVASRAAIFTGMYPHTTGAYSFDRWARHRTWVQDLADSGYFCANIGKMHFTPRDVPGGFADRIVVENPTNRTAATGGADDDWGKYLSLHGIARPNERHRTDPDWRSKFQGVAWHEEERFQSDVFIGNSAVSWIEGHRGTRPLFLQIGFTGPHEPWDPLPRHLALYDDRPVPDPVERPGELDEKPPQHLQHQRFHASTDHESVIDIAAASAGDVQRMRRHYYAKITTVDEQIGRVMAALEQRGYLEDSLVVFCSDHGELLGDHQLAYKWLMYEPIVHIPLIIQRSSGSQPGQVDDLVSLIDLGPTILEAGGIELPAYLEGRSLLPYLSGDTLPARDFVCAEDNYQIMFRTNDHKLVYYIGQPNVGELYDLRADADELDNRWGDPAFGEVKATLLAQLLEWLAASNYWNAGYKRGDGAQYALRWPSDGDAGLHGAGAKRHPLPYL